MPYTVHISDADRAYLDSLPLSDRGKAKVRDFIDYAIAQVGDAFRLDPANRPWPNSPHFQTELILLDTDAAGKRSYHKVLFVVRDDTIPYGVLVVVYVDHQ